ncbi:hypothetical protein V6N12_065164 [Hibiscus sabdariffa]|uniref:Uncharacterized protein n=1 Tax=Hibiscus sabdariffa TaxID=183260 RepID=A0ABR2G8R8_9ROSI
MDIIVYNAKHLHQEYNDAIITQLPYGMPQQRSSYKREKPPPETIKISIYGMFRTQSGDKAIGILAQDHHGLVMVGCACTIPRAHRQRLWKATRSMGQHYNKFIN